MTDFERALCDQLTAVAEALRTLADQIDGIKSGITQALEVR